MNIGIIGAGSWGTTLAVLLHCNSHNVTLWSFSPSDVETMLKTRNNPDYIPGLIIPKGIEITDDIFKVIAKIDILVIATPSQHVRSVLELSRDNNIGHPIIVNVAKGIERHTLKRMSEVVFDVLPYLNQKNYGVLSGPSHAEEVSHRKPTSLVVASSSLTTSQLIQSVFMNDYLRIYSSNDVIGVELGGSLKNVIAIGAGICDGSSFGDNTKAALITRGIAEMRRLGEALGADPHTFAGLSGLGDLIVTTMSKYSRNRYVGEEIGKGRKLRDILLNMKMVAEGVETTRSAHELAIRSNVEMPITHQMYEILFEDKDPIEATRELMTRQAKDEIWS